jgi:hypothetical protein
MSHDLIVFYINLFYACLTAFGAGFFVSRGMTGMTCVSLAFVVLEAACVVMDRVNAEKDALQEASGE